jgi:flagellar motor switch protein FliM
MISTGGDNLSRDRIPCGVSHCGKIQQLLAAVGCGPTEDTAQIETVEHNWHRPYYFSSEQLKKLNDFTEEIAAAAAVKLATLAHSNFNVTIVSTTQHYADELLGQVSGGQKGDYYLALGANIDHPCGFISISSQAATILATQLLGDLESEKSPERKLLQLEESLLLDIASTFVEAFSASCKNHNFHPAKSFVRGQWPLELQGTEEVCKIVFAVKKGESGDRAELYLLITCCELERAAIVTTQAAGKSSATDISKALLEYIRQVPVPVTVQLASTMLSFKEIINIQIDDILLLDKKIDEPIELIAGDRTVCRGRPAKSAGEYAMVITEPLYNPDKSGQNTRPVADS